VDDQICAAITEIDHAYSPVCSQVLLELMCLNNWEVIGTYSRLSDYQLHSNITVLLLQWYY